MQDAEDDAAAAWLALERIVAAEAEADSERLARKAKERVAGAVGTTEQPIDTSTAAGKCSLDMRLTVAGLRLSAERSRRK